MPCHQPSQDKSVESYTYASRLSRELSTWALSQHRDLTKSYAFHILKNSLIFSWLCNEKWLIFKRGNLRKIAREREWLALCWRSEVKCILVEQTGLCMFLSLCSPGSQEENVTGKSKQIIMVLTEIRLCYAYTQFTYLLYYSLVLLLQANLP